MKCNHHMCMKTALEGAEHEGMCVLHSSSAGKSHDMFRREFEAIWVSETEPRVFTDIYVPITVEITTKAMEYGIVFQRCEFRGDVVGKGYRSSRGVSFQGCTFNGIVAITGARTSEITFKECYFRKKLVLYGITGPEDSASASLSVEDSHCYGQTLVSDGVISSIAGKNTRYYGTVSMERMKVEGDINLQNAYFERSLDVADIKISGDLLLSNVATKDHGISIVHSCIGGSISLYDARVQGDVTILDASVAEHVHGLRLQCRSFFMGQSHIRGIINLVSLRVSARVEMIRSICRQKLDLSRASFQDAAYLSQCVLGALDMSGGEIVGALDYLDVRIIRHGSFYGLKMHSSARFQSVVRAHRLLFSDESIYMDGVVLLGGAELSFSRCDFKNVSISGTDLSKARLTNVEWPRLENGYLCVQNELSQGIDRRTVKEWIWSCEITEIYSRLRALFSSNRSKGAKISRMLHDLRDQYRDLKINYSDRGSYPEGGEFHIAEKEMARINPSTKPIDRLVLWLYRTSSYYGERYLRPAVTSVIVILISALAYRPYSADYIDALKHSANVFMFRWPNMLQPLENSSQLALYHFAYSMEGLAGPALISIFLFALRQRMKR